MFKTQIKYKIITIILIIKKQFLDGVMVAQFIFFYQSYIYIYTLYIGNIKKKCFNFEVILQEIWLLN